MERNKLPKTINFELESADSEVYLNIKKELKNDNKQGAAQSQFTKKTKPFSSLRIRRFFIRQGRSKRPMEFGCHPTGIHWMGHAIFHSEAGCINCKMDLENLA